MPIPMTVVRQRTKLGRCILLGVFTRETATRYFYRVRSALNYEAWVPKRCGLIHLESCRHCRDAETEE